MVRLRRACCDVSPYSPDVQAALVYRALEHVGVSAERDYDPRAIDRVQKIVQKMGAVDDPSGAHATRCCGASHPPGPGDASMAGASPVSVVA